MRRVTFTILLLFALMLLGSCAGDRSPSTPIQPQVSSSEGPQLLPDPESVVLSVPLGPQPSDTKVISAVNGGDLSVGLVTVKFPPRSIAKATSVTLTLVDREKVLFRIEPADLVLLKPIRIVADHLEHTDHSARKPLNVARVIDGVPQTLSTEPVGNRHTASSDTLGDFGLADTDEDGGTIRFIRYLAGPGYKTKLINAATGGVVEYDRYTVTIPAGALAEDTFITVRDPGSGFLMCELEPQGLVFLTPAELELDLRGLRYRPYTDWTVYWFDENTELWEDQGGTFNRGLLTVQLGHFSKYAAGRAGW